MGTEVIIHATKGQIKSFRGSLLWGDIKRELEVWKEQFKDEPKVLATNTINGEENTASVLVHLGSLQGRELAIDYMIGMLDVFIQIKEDEEDARRNKTK
jgi:hypothetical protein